MPTTTYSLRSREDCRCQQVLAQLRQSGEELQAVLDQLAREGFETMEETQARLDRERRRSLLTLVREGRDDD